MARRWFMLIVPLVLHLAVAETSHCFAQSCGSLRTFRSELAVLKRRLARQLKVYAASSDVEPVIKNKLRPILPLVAVWPAPIFRGPLTKLAYRRFDDHKPHHLKKALRLHGIQLGDSTKDPGKESTRPSRVSGGRRFIEYKGLLPPLVHRGSVFRTIDWPLAMTVPTAVESLTSESLSIRCQAWTWLAELGLVAPVKSIKNGWNKLSIDHQRLLLKPRARSVGMRHLKSLYEELSPRLDRSLEGDMWKALAAAGSQRGVVAAKKELYRFIARSGWRDREDSLLVNQAIKAIGYVDRPDTIRLLTYLTESHNEYIFSDAVYSLVRSGNRMGVSAMKKHVHDSRLHLFKPFIVLSLQEHVDFDCGMREGYARVMFSEIRRHKSPKDLVESNYLVDLLFTLEILDERAYWDYKQLKQTSNFIDGITGEAIQSALRRSLARRGLNRNDQTVRHTDCE